jgi:hypothetical protein
MFAFFGLGTQELIVELLGCGCVVIVPLLIILIIVIVNRKPPAKP